MANAGSLSPGSAEPSSANGTSSEWGNEENIKSFSTQPDDYPSNANSRSFKRSDDDGEREIKEGGNLPSNVLGVFGLAYETRGSDLESLFASYGQILSATVIMDRMSGRSKGFGFIYYDTVEEAQKAIAGTNGYKLHGRNIRVDYSATSKPHAPTPGHYMGKRSNLETFPDRYRQNDRSVESRRPEYADRRGGSGRYSRSRSPSPTHSRAFSHNDRYYSSSSSSRPSYGVEHTRHYSSREREDSPDRAYRNYRAGPAIERPGDARGSGGSSRSYSRSPPPSSYYYRRGGPYESAPMAPPVSYPPDPSHHPSDRYYPSDYGYSQPSYVGSMNRSPMGPPVSSSASRYPSGSASSSNRQGRYMSRSRSRSPPPVSAFASSYRSSMSSSSHHAGYPSVAGPGKYAGSGPMNSSKGATSHPAGSGNVNGYSYHSYSRQH